MLSNRLAFGVLAAICTAAAAGGGYLATRQANLGTEAAAPTVIDPATTNAGAPAVQETEAAVTPAPILEVAPSAPPRGRTGPPSRRRPVAPETVRQLAAPRPATVSAQHENRSDQRSADRRSSKRQAPADISAALSPGRQPAGDLRTDAAARDIAVNAGQRGQLRRARRLGGFGDRTAN